MRFFVKATDAGKIVRVVDRLADPEPAEVLKRFVDVGQTVEVRVATRDGSSGNVDIYRQASPADVEYAHGLDLEVEADGIVEVDGPRPSG